MLVGPVSLPRIRCRTAYDDEEEDDENHDEKFGIHTYWWINHDAYSKVLTVAHKFNVIQDVNNPVSSRQITQLHILFDFQTASSLLESEAANSKDNIKVISSREAPQMIKPRFLWHSNSFTSLLVTVKQLIRIINKATSSINLFVSGGLQGHGESVLNPLRRVQCQRGPWDLQKPGIKSGGGQTIYHSQL